MDTQTLIAVLTWTLVTVAGGLVASLVWFATRIIAQLDRLERLHTQSTHAHDLRLTKLEDWRAEAGKPHGPHTSGISS